MRDDHSHVKPPVGLTPRDVWQDQRKRDIIEAIRRYNDAGIRIPDYWINELASLVFEG